MKTQGRLFCRAMSLARADVFFTVIGLVGGPPLMVAVVGDDDAFASRRSGPTPP